MKYCSTCGALLARKIPNGDKVERFVCESCHTVHYQNPKVVAGCIPVWENKILLCRRAIKPRYGLWTLPAGFMENGETVEQAALRETFEEATANVVLKGLFSVVSIPEISQLYLMFRGELTDLNFAAGEESLDVALFSEPEIPWQDMAFSVMAHTLKAFFKDRATGQFGVHIVTLSNQNNIV